MGVCATRVRASAKVAIGEGDGAAVPSRYAVAVEEDSSGREDAQPALNDDGMTDISAFRVDRSRAPPRPKPTPEAAPPADPHDMSSLMAQYGSKGKRGAAKPKPKPKLVQEPVQLQAGILSRGS